MAMVSDSVRQLRHRLRVKAGSLLFEHLLRGVTSAGKLHPLSRPSRHGLEVLRDIPYLDDGTPEHRLDIYRPTALPGPWPVVLYVHGGSFRILSKDSHWMMGLAFARRGYLVFNINYRLAPQHRFPAALQDTCAAFRFVVEQAARFGGDPSRISFAGESAGANLVSALTVATHWPRPEPWARAAFDLGVTARAVLPACGLLQVSDTARFGRRRQLPTWLADRIAEVGHSYLGDRDHGASLDLADPLTVFERGEPPARALPAFFSAVGTSDPILDDTRRLHAALLRLGARSEARYYRGGIHAFHALVFQQRARDCWRDQHEFLARVLAG